MTLNPFVSEGPMATETSSSSSVLHQSLVGGGALLIGALMAYGATFIPSDAGYAGVGPNALPWLVSVVLMI